MQAFFQNMSQLLEAVEDCLGKRQLLPCLTLLYSGVDIVASLERRPSEGTRAAFVRWVEENLLKVQPLPCTALELYAARCGILHAFTAESDLSRQGVARPVIYAWGNAKASDLAETALRLNRRDVAVQLEELIEGFRAGLARYCEEVAQDAERMRRVEAGTGLWFVHLNQELIGRFLDISQQSGLP